MTNLCALHIIHNCCPHYQCNPRAIHVQSTPKCLDDCCMIEHIRKFADSSTSRAVTVIFYKHAHDSEVFKIKLVVENPFHVHLVTIATIGCVGNANVSPDSWCAMSLVGGSGQVSARYRQSYPCTSQKRGQVVERISELQSAVV